jgi:hypothetical protein
MRLFKEATTTPLDNFVLQMPKHKITQKEDEGAKNSKLKATSRMSLGDSTKNPKGKSILKLAQDLVAKKCGIIQDDEVSDSKILQQYLDMYKEPLTEHSMQAILKLTEVAEGKQKGSLKKKTKEGKEKKQKKKEEKIKKLWRTAPCSRR